MTTIKHYTSIEQSKKLLELGMNPESADMYYCKEYIGSNNEHFYTIPPRIGSTKYGNLPCWSLGALLEVMPIVNEGTYTMIGTLDGGAIISHKEITCVAFQESSPFNAAFKMVCWLLEKGYIKKGE